MTREAFERGAQIARERFGAECREFDIALWGMAEVFKAAGRPETTPRDMADRWHYPLASAAPNYNGFDNWAKVFPMVCKGLESAERAPYEAREFLSGRSIGMSPGYHAEQTLAELNHPPTIDRRADQLLDSEIKRKFPKVRRGSKRFKELADSKRDLARQFVRDDLSAQYARQLAEARQRFAEESKRLDVVAKHAAHLQSLAADLVALDPLCEVAAAIRTAGDSLAARVSAKLANNARILDTLTAQLGAPDLVAV